jgi:hypothetical protein
MALGSVKEKMQGIEQRGANLAFLQQQKQSQEGEETNE